MTTATSSHRIQAFRSVGAVGEVLLRALPAVEQGHDHGELEQHEQDAGAAG